MMIYLISIVYDLIIGRQVNLTYHNLIGLFKDVNTLPHISFDKNWWGKNL